MKKWKIGKRPRKGDACRLPHHATVVDGIVIGARGKTDVKVRWTLTDGVTTDSYEPRGRFVRRRKWWNVKLA